MSKSDGFFVRPKFPVAEPDQSVKPQPQEAPSQEPLTPQQMQDQFVDDLENVVGVKVPEKCKTCANLVPCVTLQLLGGAR